MEEKIRLKKEDIYRGSLILVNRLHAYREQADLELIAPFAEKEEILMKAEAAEQLLRALADIGGQQEIVPVSGWRSRMEQEKIWDDSLAENGPEFTKTYVAAPGHSEHQTGFAIDLGKRQEVIDFIRPDFPYEGICQRFRERAAVYGFVERYPAGKEALTGIGHEPWHFRYVGAPHAQIMKKEQLVLEEYISFLRAYPYGVRPYRLHLQGRRVSVSYAAAEGGVTTLSAKGGSKYAISGNNADGFIVTSWEDENE